MLSFLLAFFRRIAGWFRRTGANDGSAVVHVIDTAAREEQAGREQVRTSAEEQIAGSAASIAAETSKRLSQEPARSDVQTTLGRIRRRRS